MAQPEAGQVFDRLREAYPDARCELDFNDPFQLLVATVLSAQSTDVRVNKVTPALFDRWGTPEALAAADRAELEAVIRTTGFFRNKATALLGLSRAIVDDFDGLVPIEMADLVKLPGVGRKTANVVLGNAFGVPGFPVDTHVIRVTGRLRWRTDWRNAHPDPVHIEREITACFPPEEWTDLSHRLILHGRATCHARKPDCAACPLNDTCPSAGIFG